MTETGARWRPASAPPFADAVRTAHDTLLELVGVGKSFGPTRANRALSFSIRSGEVVGLVGANGAGKSTLMRILAGVTAPDEGTIRFAGTALDPQRHSPLGARAHGIRIVHQELSLCDSLSVAENFYLEEPSVAAASVTWRRHYARLARSNIEAIFPGSGIDPGAAVGRLTLAQRQMIEIARAASDPRVRLLILDEPTSSLDARRSEELRAFIIRRAAQGVAFIFISHKLAELKAIATRVLVMRGGELVWQSAAEQISLTRMVELMAGGAVLGAEAAGERGLPERGEVLVRLAQGSFSEADRLEMRRGEVVGLAGLEGNGQRAFLHALRSGPRRERTIERSGTVAFVSGDRGNEGVFALWNVVRNASLAALARRSPLAWLEPVAEAKSVRHWLTRTRVDEARFGSDILELSGGNQQKVLMARALAADPDIILLDDPTRGVDVSVKRDFYGLIRDAAASGKLVVWLSSEDIEFLECDRVLVFHEGRMVRDLAGEEISEDKVVTAAFERRLVASDGSKGAARRSTRFDPFRIIPLLTVALVFGAIAILNPEAATPFGLDLLMSASVPLVLVAIAQMFVIGGSEIDLGVGALAGLANVLSATLLANSFGGGMLALAALWLLYCLLGLLIRVRGIPAIVVTLGASFVWLGSGYALQPTPGGSSPGWLSAVAAVKPLGIPASIWAVVLGGLAAWLINGSRVGTVLRGYGANPKALEQAGWSPIRAYFWRYGLAGGFALLAGLSMTAINTASDINSGSSYTLLSVAAVVIGGSALAGGAIAPVGVICGALTLSLISSLLGFLSVSTDYNAAVQGGLLILILLLRQALGRSAR